MQSQVTCTHTGQKLGEPTGVLYVERVVLRVGLKEDFSDSHERESYDCKKKKWDCDSLLCPFLVITSSKTCNEFCTRFMFILLLISLSVWLQNVHSAFFLQLPCGLICKEYYRIYDVLSFDVLLSVLVFQGAPSLTHTHKTRHLALWNMKPVCLPCEIIYNISPTAWQQGHIAREHPVTMSCSCLE